MYLHRKWTPGRVDTRLSSNAMAALYTPDRDEYGRKMRRAQHKSVRFKQSGSADCGVYAIAYAAELVLGTDPDALYEINFCQKKMRKHLLETFQNNRMTRFPSNDPAGFSRRGKTTNKPTPPQHSLQNISSTAPKTTPQASTTPVAATPSPCKFPSPISSLDDTWAEMFDDMDISAEMFTGAFTPPALAVERDAPRKTPDHPPITPQPLMDLQPTPPWHYSGSARFVTQPTTASTIALTPPPQMPPLDGATTPQAQRRVSSPWPSATSRSALSIGSPSPSPTPARPPSLMPPLSPLMPLSHEGPPTPGYSPSQSGSTCWPGSRGQSSPNWHPPMTRRTSAMTPAQPLMDLCLNPPGTPTLIPRTLPEAANNRNSKNISLISSPIASRTRRRARTADRPETHVLLGAPAPVPQPPANRTHSIDAAERPGGGGPPAVTTRKMKMKAATYAPPTITPATALNSSPAAGSDHTPADAPASNPQPDANRMDRADAA